MKLNIVINQVNGRRLDKLRRELDYMSATDMFRTIPLAEERREVEEYMADISPKGEPSETKRWLAEHGRRALLPRFATGWRVKRLVIGNRLAWSITNVLESSSLDGARAKFRSVEFGSRSSTWKATRKLSFLAHSQWFRFSAGQEIKHVGNPPADVLGKVSTFVETYMIPQIASKVEVLINARLSRL